MNTTLELVEKETIRIELPQLKKIQYLAKLQSMRSRFDNRIIESQHAIYSWSSNKVGLDKSKTTYKLIYSEPFVPAEIIYGQTLPATILVAKNPIGIDFEKFKAKYPEAYVDCLKPQGQHLRLNIKI